MRTNTSTVIVRVKCREPVSVTYFTPIGSLYGAAAFNDRIRTQCHYPIWFESSYFRIMQQASTMR